MTKRVAGSPAARAAARLRPPLRRALANNLGGAAPSTIRALCGLGFVSTHPDGSRRVTAAGAAVARIVRGGMDSGDRRIHILAR